MPHVGYIKQQGQEKNDVFTLHDRGSHFLMTKQAHLPIIIYHQCQRANVWMAFPGNLVLDNLSRWINEVWINEGLLYLTIQPIRQLAK